MTQLLNSSTRIAKYAIHASSGELDNFDRENVGWTVTDLSQRSAAEISQMKTEQPSIRVYNPDERLGMSNQGHTFADSLSDEQRFDLLQFLKAI